MIQNSNLKVLILILLIVTNVYAKNPKAVIVAERSTPVGTEQVGITFEKDKLVITSNSNFLNKTYPNYYGLFELKIDKELRKEILSLVREEKLSEQNIYLSRHDLNIFINNKNIPLNSKKFSRVQILVQKIFGNPKLKLKKGIVVKNEKEQKKIVCSKIENDICVFKYGYVHKI